MEETWRWFGPKDAVGLQQIRQTGARGIVTSLHDIPYGEVWSRAAIEERKAMIAADAVARPALERGREPADP
jgi:mannonate dehydratase